MSTHQDFKHENLWQRKISLVPQTNSIVCVCVLDVAASAYGRNFLSTHEEGQALIDVFCSALAEAPTGIEWYVCV